MGDRPGLGTRIGEGGQVGTQMWAFVGTQAGTGIDLGSRAREGPGAEAWIGIGRGAGTRAGPWPGAGAGPDRPARGARRADPRLRSPPPWSGLRCPLRPGAGVEPAEAEPGTWIGVQAWATPGSAEQAITRPRGGGLGLTSHGAPPLGQFDWLFSVKPAPCPIPLVSNLVLLGSEDRLRPSPSYLRPCSQPNHGAPIPASDSHRLHWPPHRHLKRTLQRPSQTLTPTDVPRDTRKPYPETHSKRSFKPPLQRSEPVRFVFSRSNAAHSGDLTHLEGDQTAVDTETTGRSCCPGDGFLLSRPGFQRIQSSPAFIASVPLVPPSPPFPRSGWRSFEISAGVQVSSPNHTSTGKACYHAAPCSRISSTTKSFPSLGLTFLLPSFRQDPDLRICNSQAKA